MRLVESVYRSLVLTSFYRLLEEQVSQAVEGDAHEHATEV